MSKFDRYILGQCFSVFGFFTLVFFLIVWINKAVLLFDELIGDGHSAFIFLEFSSLALPSVMTAIIPLSSFSATVYVTNRLSNESELAVMQATGFSPWRLARPFAVFGGLCAVILAVFTLYLAPLAGYQQSQREVELSSDLAAKLLKDGVFQHPLRGVTVYVRDIAPTGELSDIYISDRRDPDQSVTYTAATAYLLQQDDQTVLVMADGYAQTLDETNTTLSLTQFRDLTYNIGNEDMRRSVGKISVSYVPTLTLIADTEQAQFLTNRDRAYVNEELHRRFQYPLLAFATALVGFAALYVAGFSRFGVGRYIIFAIVILVVMKMIESIVTPPARATFALWPTIYAPSLFGIWAAVVMLYISQRPRKIAPPQIETEGAV